MMGSSLSLMMVLLSSVIGFGLLPFHFIICCEAGLPTEAEFFPLQFVNHNLVPSSQRRQTRSTTITSDDDAANDDNDDENPEQDETTTTTSQTTTTSSSLGGEVYWKQRFYRNAEYFAGPGHPIFLILGGEGAIPPSVGIHYPLVVHVYAKAFGALVIEPEHRFYGASQPISESAMRNQNPDPRLELLTPKQALQDAVRLTQHIQKSYGCAMDKNSPYYCPVISVGGSYPGFLSAMARLLFPDTIDLSYAASAPMKFYAQQVPQDRYYRHITKVAQAALPGCAQAVRQTLQYVVHFLQALTKPEQLVQVSESLLGVCPNTVPRYMIEDPVTFIQELIMVVGYTFANHNMAYYPPSNQTALYKSCSTFLSSESRSFRQTTATRPFTVNDDVKQAIDRLRRFLVQSLSGQAVKPSPNCFDLSYQLPTGPHATLSGGDWSGVGTGPAGESWDFQTCSLLIETIGFPDDDDDDEEDAPPQSMFYPPRPFSLDWLKSHCQRRFGKDVVPQPLKLVHEWGFDDLIRHTNASYILFTNGLRDGWSVSGIQSNLSRTIVALNFPNGAHHSDLWGSILPPGHDTSDLEEGFQRIQQLLASWLEDLPSYRRHHKSALVATTRNPKNMNHPNKHSTETSSMPSSPSWMLSERQIILQRYHLSIWALVPSFLALTVAAVWLLLFKALTRQTKSHTTSAVLV